MFKATVKSKVFIKIWIWSLVYGVVLGIGLAYLIGKLTGLLDVPAGQDDMAQGIVFILLIFGIGNLVSYIVAIVLGQRIVRQQQQAVGIYLAKALPFSIAAFLLSISILFPLLLFGSLVAAFIVTFSINKMSSETNISEPSFSDASAHIQQSNVGE